MTEWPRPLALVMLAATALGLLWQAVGGTDWQAELLGPLGLLVGCLLALFGFHREWWVSGGQYRRELKRAERLEQMLYAALNVSEKVAHVAEQGSSAGTP